MANIGKRWRRIMCVGCSHGNRAHPQHIKDVLEFRRRFQPDIRIHLGDLIDTACFRSGAAGTKDEVERPEDDMGAAERFLERYEPNWLAFGNHDWRLYELSTHPKAILAALASQLLTSINSRLQRLKCRTVPYDIEDGWFTLGGVAWGMASCSICKPCVTMRRCSAARW